MISAISALIVVISVFSGCGQKGPPLPPLIRMPVAPAVTANRFGSTIELGLTVPAENADGSRPANLTRIDIYAVTGPTEGMTDAEIMKLGTKVASLPVKTPRNPNDTVEAGESPEVLDPLEGRGLDQGASTKVAEQIAASILTPNEATRTARAAQVTADRPLLWPQASESIRTYVGVGIDRRGRPGRFSTRAVVPLSSAPPPPSQPTVTYTETTILISWNPPAGRVPDSAPGVLASKPLGPALQALQYNVYDTSTGVRLTPMPIAGSQFEDSRIEWGAKRCYAVRAVQPVGGTTLESDAGEPRCETLVDTFAPAAPKGLQAVATGGAVNLIWEANKEGDIAGYLVLRAQLPDTKLVPVTPMPVPDTSFADTVPQGVSFVYAVEAVDKAGNVSQPSNRVEETAR